MISIVRHYKFNEEPTTFDKLGVGSLYVTQRQLQSLGDSATVNIKINNADDLNGFNSISLDTGNHFNLGNSVIVYKGH